MCRIPVRRAEYEDGKTTGQESVNDKHPHIIPNHIRALMTVAIAAALFAPSWISAPQPPLPATFRSKTTRNALQLLHFWDADVTLYNKAATPLPRPLRDAAYVHGESGMEGYDLSTISANRWRSFRVYRYPGC